MRVVVLPYASQVATRVRDRSLALYFLFQHLQLGDVRPLAQRPLDDEPHLVGLLGRLLALPGRPDIQFDLVADIEHIAELVGETGALYILGGGLQELLGLEDPVRFPAHFGSHFQVEAISVGVVLEGVLELYQRL